MPRPLFAHPALSPFISSTPTGPAGGDLTGQYPNPLIAPGAITDSMVNDVSWSKITGAPTTLPPSGPAGGDLKGTYPNPALGIIQASTVEFLANGLWAAVPGGAALSVNDGNLTHYNNAAPGWEIALEVYGGRDDIIFRRHPAGSTLYTDLFTFLASGDVLLRHAVQLGPLAGTAAAGMLRYLPGTGFQGFDGTTWTTFGAAGAASPPTGPAGGVLNGTYPNPGFGVGVVDFPNLTQPVLNLLLPPYTVPANAGMVPTVQANGTVSWAISTGGPPGGAAGGDLLGSTYPNPVIAPGVVTTAKLDAPTAARLVPTQTAGTAGMVLTASGTGLLAWQDSIAGKPAGGALTGSYPNPGVQYSAITGIPAALPPSGTAGGDLSGVYPNPTVNAVARSKWVDSGTTLTPVMTTRQIVIPASNALRYGPRTVQGRLIEFSATDVCSFGINQSLQAGDAGWTQDDVTKPSWSLNLASDPADDFEVNRIAPAGTQTTLLKLNSQGSLNLATPGQSNSAIVSATSVGGVIISTNNPSAPMVAAQSSWTLTLDANADACYIQRRAPNAAAGTVATTHEFYSDGSLAIYGPTGQKSTGTTWANPSDRRLKNDITDYPTGLAAILGLQPRTFLYNGRGGSQAGLRGYGYIADEVEPVMPEMLRVTKAKLNADDAEDTDIQTLDTSNITLALVNAVKELADRVTALEAR